MKTLLITNDFPPRPGGIQSFVHNLAIRQPAGSLVVYSSDWAGSAEFDAQQPFEVVREDTQLLLPTPKVARRSAELARAHGCEAVWFASAAPLGLLAERLRRTAGISRAVALTHGHEIGWGALPGARTLLRRIGDGLDVMTYLGEYFRVRLAAALQGRCELRQLASGIETEVFRPDVDASAVRAAHGLTDRPVVVCVSRVVPRKGQDTLIKAMPALRRKVPDVALLIVGPGKYLARLKSLAAELGVERDVMFTGSVPWPDLPAHYAAGDVFAMPCRNRYRGLEVEGLGVVYLEAAATGLPVLAGRSGGAPDAVLDGETGYVVDGRDVAEVVDRLALLLTDATLAQSMGAAGRRWVEKDWQWSVKAQALTDLLAGG